MWGTVDITFSKDRFDFIKDISKFQSYMELASDEKKLEYNNFIQEFYERKDEFYEGFFFPIGEDFISLELNKTIQMKEQ
jgi:hypothetical protein